MILGHERDNDRRDNRACVSPLLHDLFIQYIQVLISNYL